MSAETLRALPPRQTDWFLLDAARVAAFADVTEDWQPIHLDGTAAQAAGFDAPVVHGFLTLSMLSAMSYQVVPELPGVRSSVNYGFDRIRFVSPVAVGTRVRGSFTVASVDEGEGHLLSAVWHGIRSGDLTVDLDERLGRETRVCLTASAAAR